MTTTYTIRTLRDGDKIGETELTAEQYSRYEANAQWPEGAIRLDDLPGHRELSITMDGKTVVWLEAA